MNSTVNIENRVLRYYIWVCQTYLNNLDALYHRKGWTQVRQRNGSKRAKKGQVMSLITVIMVISTRAKTAVITSPVPKWNYYYIATLIPRIGLNRGQEEVVTQIRETLRQNQVQIKRDKGRKSDPIITLITVIVVISTRANIAVKLNSESRAGHGNT